MTLRIVATIFSKEMLDILRDRRTLLAMFAIPLLLYPSIFVIGSQVAVIQQGQLERHVSKVAIRPSGCPYLSGWLGGARRIRIVDSDHPVTALQDKLIDAWVTAKDDIPSAMAAGDPVEVMIHYDVTEAFSREAAVRIEETLDEARASILSTRLKEQGLPAGFATPIQITRSDDAPSHKATGTVLGMTLPFIMILMVGVGAFYPAIDLTAGEKERGTFETLLAAPVSPIEIVCGKFLTVFSVSLFSGLLNLGSMSLTFWFQLWQLEEVLGVYEISLSLGTVLCIMAGLCLLALLISAVMMSIAMCTRSFREGQNFLTPFILLLLFPAGAVVVPNVSLNTATSIIPVTNVALLFRDLLMEQSDPMNIFSVLASTASYALLALLLAARLFQREEVVLSHDGGVPITLRRSAFRRRERPSAGTALGIAAVSALMVFYLGTYFQGLNVMAGLLVTQWCLIFAPTVIWLWYTKVNLRTGLALHLPASWGVLGPSLIIGAVWVVLATEGTFLQSRYLPMPKEIESALTALFTTGRTHHVGFVLLATAVSPAICEEVLFRGALLTGLRERVPVWAALPVTALLFGAAHFSIHRAPMTMLSGLVLAYVVWRSGSLYLGILAHLMLNAAGTLAQLSMLPAPVQQYLEGESFKETGLPWWVVAGAITLFLAGIAWLEYAARARGPRAKASGTSDE